MACAVCTNAPQGLGTGGSSPSQPPCSKTGTKAFPYHSLFNAGGLITKHYSGGYNHEKKDLIGVISFLGIIVLLQLVGLLLVRLGIPVYYIQSDGEGIRLVRGTGDPQSFPELEPGSAPSLNADATPLIIDTDMAGDDWMAILYLMQRPDVDIIAITVTGAGEAHCGPGIRNALDLLMLAGRPKVPVSCGRESPLLADHSFPIEWRNAVDGLFGLSLPQNPNQPSNESAPELISRLLHESEADSM